MRWATVNGRRIAARSTAVECASASALTAVAVPAAAAPVVIAAVGSPAGSPAAGISPTVAGVADGGAVPVEPQHAHLALTLSGSLDEAVEAALTSGTGPR